MGYQQVGRVEELEEVCRAPLRLPLPLHLPLLTASPAEALNSSPQHSEGAAKAWPLNLGPSIINEET